MMIRDLDGMLSHTETGVPQKVRPIRMVRPVRLLRPVRIVRSVRMVRPRPGRCSGYRSKTFSSNILIPRGLA